jgi:hypothetical protein
MTPRVAQLLKKDSPLFTKPGVYYRKHNTGPTNTDYLWYILHFVVCKNIVIYDCVTYILFFSVFLKMIPIGIETSRINI